MNCRPFNRIPDEKVAWVRELLREDELSQLAIARLVGIHRGTIGRIARGTYRSDAGRKDRKAYQAIRPRRRPDGLYIGDIGRCSECGGRVYLPCIACKIRRQVDATVGR